MRLHGMLSTGWDVECSILSIGVQWNWHGYSLVLAAAAYFSQWSKGASIVMSREEPLPRWVFGCVLCLV